ncbi:MAG: hypothetical protein MZU97_05895 [Bacillus subtilis]|nr:hypothetical protein [Bacillus subtilis]
MAGSFVILMIFGYFVGKRFPLTNKDTVAVRTLLKRRYEATWTTADESRLGRSRGAALLTWPSFKTSAWPSK